MKKLNFGIIGAGAVTPHHINALKQIDQVNIAAVCGRNPDKTKTLATKFGLDWTTDLTDLLENPDIDVIDVTVPSGLHAQIGVQAARNGKHVVVEKPIDVSLEKADNLINTCQQNNVVLAVISQFRFMEPMVKLYQLLKQNKLGKLIQGDAYIKWYRPQSYYDSGEWRGTFELDGGGPFINQGIHFIDLLLSVMGKVKWVSAKTKTVGHDIEVEDLGMAMLEFENGAYGIIQASTATYPGLPARLEIHGTRGTVTIEGEKLAFMEIQGQKAVKEDQVNKGGASDPMAIDVKPFKHEFLDIIQSINEGKEPFVSGQQARQSLELILAIYESSKKGVPVNL